MESNFGAVAKALAVKASRIFAVPAMESNFGAVAKALAVKASRIFAVLFRRVLHLAYDFAPWVVGLQGEG